MKVLDVNKAFSETRSQYQASEKLCGESKGLEFHLQMTSLSEGAHQKYITELQDKIMRQGNALKQKASLEEMQQYRSLITELIRETVSNSFEHKRTGAFDTRGRHKVFVVIKNINEKLDEMTKEILSEQQDNIKLVDMVDGIRGLLVDLLL